MAWAQDDDVPEPEAPREFRAAWVATVANIDWPSKKGLSTDQQKQEMVAILDKCVELNLNAIVFQVRPAADALYESKLEPWSDVLTGEMGKAPEPFYDPLTFTVEEAHKRGIEVHCWFNPYRALHPSTKTISDNHISKTNPEIAKKYGDFYWLNPTDKRTQDLSLNVIMDVVKRYDIDGVHMDDYFYPYPEYGKGADFPDEDTWKAYKDGGGELEKGDWRREAVDKFVERLYSEVKATKPHVKVGISPFGIAKPGNPPEVASGFNQYETLYADAQKWLNEGWVDYYTPQLYWGIASPQPYMYLLQWWMGQNSHNRHLWPGLYTSKYVGKCETIAEIPNQIAATRFLGATGEVHFSMKPLMQNTNGIDEILKEGVYKEPALIPASPWIDDVAPEKPEVTLNQDKATTAAQVSWKTGSSEQAWLWTVYTLQGKKWTTHVMPATSTTLALQPDSKGAMPTKVAVAAVDRNGNESEKVTVELKANSKVTIEDAKPEGQVQ
jgi:uncharacterized lipoprotein YddW (UPF0748 family)